MTMNIFIVLIQHDNPFFTAMFLWQLVHSGTYRYDLLHPYSLGHIHLYMAVPDLTSFHKVTMTKQYIDKYKNKQLNKQIYIRKSALLKINLFSRNVAVFDSQNNKQAKLVSSLKNYWKPLTPSLHLKVEDFNHINFFWPSNLRIPFNFLFPLQSEWLGTREFEDILWIINAVSIITIYSQHKNKSFKIEKATKLEADKHHLLKRSLSKNIDWKAQS